MSAFEKIVISYEKEVYNIAYKMFGNSEDAQDVAQEVFIKIYKSIKKYNFKSKLYTWIYRITVNTCIDELRKRKGKTTVSMNQDITYGDNEIESQFEDDKEKTPEEHFLQKENINKVQNSLNKLSDKHRVIIVLRYIKELEYEEISEVLKCSVGTVKSRINRAKVKLKQIFFEEMEQSKESERLNRQRGGDQNEI